MASINLLENVKKGEFFGFNLEAEDLFGLLQYDEDVYLPVILTEPGSIYVGFYPSCWEGPFAMEWVKFPTSLQINRLLDGWPTPEMISRSAFRAVIDEERLKALLNDYEE